MYVSSFIFMTGDYPFHPSLKKVFWKDVRKEVHKVAPIVAKFIDEIDPGKNYPMYEACYPYGSFIVKEGICYYPNNKGKLVTISDPTLPNDIKHDLAYADHGIGCGIIIQNFVEISLTANRFTPQNLLTPGFVFALWYFLEKQPSFHPSDMFNLSSGVRSIFLLPNIGDAISHKNLRKEFDIKIAAPKDLFSQWELFCNILQHPKAQCKWHTKIIYFSNKWLEKFLSNDNKWRELMLYLLRERWQQSALYRNKIFYDFALSQIQSKRNLRPNPYIADTAKHLILAALSGLPGFAVPQDNIGAPIDILQKIFLDVYGLKQYPPIFLQPTYFSLESKSRPIYYSLAYPTSIEFSPHCRKDHTTLVDIRELAYLMDIYLEEIPKNYLKINNTPIISVANDVRFDYYHDKHDREKRIQHTSEIPKSDPTLLTCPGNSQNKVFPITAPFIRGCVKISNKTT